MDFNSLASPFAFHSPYLTNQQRLREGQPWIWRLITAKLAIKQLSHTVAVSLRHFALPIFSTANHFRGWLRCPLHWLRLLHLTSRSKSRTNTVAWVASLCYRRCRNPIRLLYWSLPGHLDKCMAPRSSISLNFSSDTPLGSGTSS